MCVCMCVCARVCGGGSGGGGNEIPVFYCIKYGKELHYITICLILCLFHLHQVEFFNQQL
jgi:hypothetical protein